MFPRILALLRDQFIPSWIFPKKPWRAASISQICGVWERNSICCLRMENFGNSPFPVESDPAPGRLLIPEQLRIPLEWEFHGMGISSGHWPWHLLPSLPWAEFQRFWKNLEELLSCDQADTEQLLGDNSMESFPVFHWEWDHSDLPWG